MSMQTLHMCVCLSKVRFSPKNITSAAHSPLANHAHGNPVQVCLLHGEGPHDAASEQQATGRVVCLFPSCYGCLL